MLFVPSWGINLYASGLNPKSMFCLQHPKACNLSKCSQQNVCAVVWHLILMTKGHYLGYNRNVFDQNIHSAVENEMMSFSVCQIFKQTNLNKQNARSNTPYTIRRSPFVLHSTCTLDSAYFGIYRMLRQNSP